jgi:mono/diheme cytochrome c family protein
MGQIQDLDVSSAFNAISWRQSRIPFHSGTILGLTLLFIILLSIIPARTTIASTDDADLASIVRGGRLYDNWHKEIKERVPENRQPAYPVDKAFASQPEVNWRCKECHGWDYLGNKGTYSKGPHFTGIKGIDGLAGVPPENIITILKDKNHNYSGLLNEGDLIDLANFVSKGQVNMDDFIRRKTRKAKGDNSKHKEYYDTICANCHGNDGMHITTIQPLGVVAHDNPWKALHKILNGHPHETMPALRVLGMQTVVDILAYVQTLPDKNILSSVIRGGRLYDDWFEEKEIVAKPELNSLRPYDRKHPAYPKEGVYAKKPRSNWRCKECHGWDYLGNKGAYAQGSHFTGIKGVRGKMAAPREEIIAILKDENHQYEGVLDINDLSDLANFVSKGQIDMDNYILRKTRMAKGDSSKHKSYYVTICANCHGSDGTRMPTIPALGSIAKSNPWEALHKILNGHPDEEMPALRVLDIQVLVDVLAYLQTLPSER